MEELLINTCVPQNVKVDLKNMKEEYEEIILPFMNSHKTHFRYFLFRLYF